MSKSRRPYYWDEIRIVTMQDAWDSNEFRISMTLFTAGEEMGEMLSDALPCNLTDGQEQALTQMVGSALRSVLLGYRTDINNRITNRLARDLEGPQTAV